MTVSFIIVFKALSKDHRIVVPWELLFVDDLVSIETSLEKLIERVRNGKLFWNRRVCVWIYGRPSSWHLALILTFSMILSNILEQYVKLVLSVASILCTNYTHWVDKKWSGLKTIKSIPDYTCSRCSGAQGSRPIDGCPTTKVKVGDSTLDAEDWFCDLGEMLNAGGGSKAAATARHNCTRGKFR